MSTPAKLKTDYFLNRIALEEMKNVYSINPVDIVQRVFSFATLPEMLELFRNLSISAMDEKFNCSKSDPGSLLYFSNRLEELIEACYLLAKKKKLRLVKKSKSTRSSSHLRLTDKDLVKAMIVVEQFFKYKTLPKWKEALNHWVECSLSNYSIVERINPDELLPFCEQIEKLIQASYSLSAFPTSKKFGKID